MNLKHMEAFVAVADGKSFSKAAKMLYLTQPTISAHVSALEKELGVRLFVRNTKEVTLSEDGKLLYGYAKQMIVIQRKIESVFHKEEQVPRQRINIAASTVPSQYLLPQILAKFSESYPSEQFKIVELDSAKVVEEVARGNAEIGFTGTVLEKKFCKYIPFYQDELVVITPNTEKYAQYQQVQECIEKGSTDWVSRQPMILREEGSGTRKETGKLFRKIGLQLEDMNIVASIENQETIKRSVSNGMGISVMSRLAAKEEIESGKVLCFPLAGRVGVRDLNIVYNKNVPYSTVVEKMLCITNDMYSVSNCI